MTVRELEDKTAAQRQFFAGGNTLGVSLRLRYLRALRKAIQSHLPRIHEALKQDLGKSESESYMCETGLALSELTYIIKRLPRLAKPHRVKTPISQAVAKSYILPSPYGCTAVISPWNYPFLLSVCPLVSAVAAGNTVMLKTSSSAPHTADVLSELLGEVFGEEYVTVIKGGEGVNEAFAATKFDYVFFTGGKIAGKAVYECAASNLTPVTLELGGKSPCVVTRSADIPLAARRIVWGKFLNLGQTCVAPDYVLCAREVRDRLVAEIKKQITVQFGANPLLSPDYGKMINKRHFDRVLALIDPAKVVCGGESDEPQLRIAPTVMTEVAWDDKVMQEEIFGPVLPVLECDGADEAMAQIAGHDAPLAFYIFSSERKEIKKFITRLGFGGGCVNDCVAHLATPHMPFGGFRESGMGGYHGKYGFYTFSHLKSVMDKKTFIDLPFRYSPYTPSHAKAVRRFLK